MVREIVVMAVSAPLLAHIHRLVAPAAGELGSDAELLRRFVGNRDQAAFAGLVSRHGPMVLRLCRRVLGDVHAAEDACQAAFLVLARKAGRIRHPETLAAWLHGVAYRLALKAKAADVRRRQIETQRLQNAPSGQTTDPLAEVSARELLAILDAELQCLPERFRLPLILCCLEGRSQPEAARLLGWTPGSVKGRLERGRTKLHQRLLRRGLTLSAALLAMEAMQGTASARLPALLNSAILRAASATTTEGGISTAVMALAEGSIGSVASVKLQLVASLVLVVGALAGGFGAFIYSHLTARPEEERRTAQPRSPAKKSDLPGAQRDKPFASTDRYGDPLPPGVLARMGTIRLRRAHDVFRLPDRDAFLSVSPERENTSVRVWQMSTGKMLRQMVIPLQRITAAVSSNGEMVALSGFDKQSGTKTVFFYDVATGKRIGELPQTGLSYALAISADGKMIAAQDDDKIVRLWDAEHRTEIRRCQATNKSYLNRLVFSPDGKMLASAGMNERTVHLWDTATGRELRVLGEGPGLRCNVVFSQDGKTLATGSMDDKTVRLWDATTGQEIRQFKSEK